LGAFFGILRVRIIGKMFLITATILLIFKLFLAGKDATSYLLKDKIDNELTFKRIKRWHRDGAILDFLFTAVLAWASGSILECFIQSFLIRLAIYDLAFNYWAGLNIHYLGSTSAVDRIFVKIFGVNGAVQKSLAFLAVLILWGLIRIFV
jgi:hypothetical protein